MEVRWGNCTKKRKRRRLNMGLKDIDSLAHTKWNCKNHIDTVGKNRSRIGENIKNQLKEEQLGEQLVMSEVGPFKGGKKQSLRSWQTVLHV